MGAGAGGAFGVANAAVREGFRGALQSQRLVVVAGLDGTVFGVGAAMAGCAVEPAVADAVAVELAGVLIIARVAASALRFVDPWTPAFFDAAGDLANRAVAVLAALARFVHGPAQALGLLAGMARIAVHGGEFLAVLLVDRL